MLKVDIKSKIYKMKNENFKALDNVKFEVENTGIVCILGPSGSGKTTLMNIIGALDSDFDGDVIVNNKSIKESKSKDLDSYRKNTIGFIFQQFYLINKFTAYDNVNVALNLSNVKDKKNKVMDLLKKVEMDKFSKRKVNVLSGGQKQRIAIARALANDPDIILADEPTGALDSKISIEIMELLKELSKTKLVLIITHSQELTDKYADTIIKMEDGKVINIENVKDKKNKDVLTSSNSKSGMSYFTAFKYSLKNLFSRKARVISTSIGMSIGIIGIGLALALSNGTMNMAKSQVEGIMPVNMISATIKSATDSKPVKEMMTGDDSKMFKFSDLEDIKKLNSNIAYYWSIPTDVTKEFLTEVSLSKTDTESTDVETTSFITMNGFEPYENVTGDLTLGRSPTNKDEIVISLNTAEYLIGVNKSIKINDIIDKDIYIKIAPMRPSGKNEKDNITNKILPFKIVGITSINTMGYSMYQNTMDTLNLYETMYNEKKEDMIFMETYIYLNNNLNTSEIKNVINDLNTKQDKFEFKGAADSTLSGVETVLTVVQNVLIGFSSISVIVAILMIGIVIYISVIERISEIGILRAIGARKKDIRNIFLSESVIIGLLSGLLGVLVTNILCVIINTVIVNILNSYGMNMGNVQIANLSNVAALSLIVVCVILAAIAGIIPSLKASKMDPIVALRRS